MAIAATYNWDGGASTTLWSDVANWDPDGLPSSSVGCGGCSDLLIFGGTGETLSNDVGHAYELQFSASAGAYDLGGPQSMETRGITNQSSVMQAVSMNGITLDGYYGPQTWDAGSGGLSVSSSLMLGGADLTIQGSGNTLISGNIYDNGLSKPSNTLIKAGPGTLTLSGTNDSFHLEINQGAVAIGDSANVGNGGTLTLDGGTLEATGTYTLAKRTYIDSGGGTFDTGSNTLTLSNTISGTGALTKTGSGTLTLTGNNNYTGGSTISAGTLQIGNGSTTGSITGNITNNGTLIFNRSDASGFAGNITGSGGLVKSGGGTLTLSGNNDYSGSTTLSDGTIAVSSNSSLGTASGGLSFNGGTLQTTASFTTNRTTTLNAGGGQFNTDATTTLTHNGDIDGSGALTKLGDGTLILRGDNNYSGGTTVSAGTLHGDALSLQGNILNNAAVIFDQAALDGLHDGDMSGSGSLTKTGDALLELTGTNTYSGGTTVSGGGLWGDTDSIQGNIVNNASVIFQQGLDGTYAGDMSGTGILSKTGAGTVTLTGSNNYSGGTDVSGGTLRGDSNSLQGDIFNNAAVVFDQAFDGTYAGKMQGSGSLSKEGAGTLSLTGINSHAYTNIMDGTLSVSSDSNLGDSSGQIIFLGGTLQTTENFSTSRNAISRSTAHAAFNTDSGTTLTFNGALSSMGTGGLRKEGKGVLILNGRNTYTGPTSINAGTLRVNGSIDSATTINNGGSLGGNGTVGSVTINSGGALAPGNSIGTLNVSGDVDFSGGGVYQVEVDAAGNSDQIVASGTANLGGGSVQVLPEAGDYNISTDYTILSAGTINGTFDSVSSSLAFLDPTLSYDASNVYLNLTRNDISYGDVADTPNQRAVGDAVTDIADNGANGDMKTLVTQVNTLSGDGARQAYDSLSGVQHAGIQTLLLQGHQRFANLIGNRSGALGARPGAVAKQATTPRPVHLAYNGDLSDLQLTSADTGLNEAQGSGLWLTPQAGIGDIDDTDNASGADYNWYGLYGGADTWLDNRRLVGVAVGLSRTDIDLADGNATSDALELAAYGRWQDEERYLDASLQAGHHQTDTSRHINVNTLNRTANASYDARSFALSLEAGQTTHSQDGNSVTPFVGLRYASLKREGFREQGASDTNLNLGSNTQESLQGRLGVMTKQRIVSATGRQLHWDASVAWAREFKDTTSTFRTRFEGAPSSAFSIDGPELDRNRIELGTSLNVDIGKETTFRLGYAGELATSHQSHTASATVQTRW